MQLVLDGFYVNHNVAARFILWAASSRPRAMLQCTHPQAFAFALLLKVSVPGPHRVIPHYRGPLLTSCLPTAYQLPTVFPFFTIGRCRIVTQSLGVSATRITLPRPLSTVPHTFFAQISSHMIFTNQSRLRLSPIDKASNGKRTHSNASQTTSFLVPSSANRDDGRGERTPTPRAPAVP
jgi:hypothetical protein